MIYSMIHITRDCVSCGNPTVTKLPPLIKFLGPLASLPEYMPPWVLFPTCANCEEVQDDYGLITDYDEYDEGEYWAEEDETSEWDEHLAECGMWQDGRCTMVGSAFFDFECLIRQAYKREMEEE